MMDPDGPKTNGSYGSGSTTLEVLYCTWEPADAPSLVPGPARRRSPTRWLLTALSPYSPLSTHSENIVKYSLYGRTQQTHRQDSQLKQSCGFIWQFWSGSRSKESNQCLSMRIWILFRLCRRRNVEFLHEKIYFMKAIGHKTYLHRYNSQFARTEIRLFSIFLWRMQHKPQPRLLVNWWFPRGLVE